jgi:predicted dehydrogenase/threonine dehydrogenase-like Zn-dependent dehydrogenase
MKQVLQHLRGGQIELAEVPCPLVRPGHLLIQSSCSLISAGTERMLVEFGRAGLLAKARAQPDKVSQVLQKIRTDGLMPTLEAVFSRLDEPMPLGYCNAGRVVEVGRGVDGFVVGDRVVSNGPHAEMICVPATLAARIPDQVDDASASFTVLGAVALHGVRLLRPTLGECFAVIGLGLLGQMAAQFLRAHGCRVLGIDPHPARCALAGRYGCQTLQVGEGADALQAAQAFSRGRGVDGVLITASASGDEIIHESAEMCRKRGRIVLVGVVGLNLKRADFYAKELTFQVSCSYGPGRYDPRYEDEATDYPLPYVRWTVARNFEAVLDALAAGQLDVRPLISRTVPHADAAAAYDAVLRDASVLGMLLKYPDGLAPVARTTRLQPSRPAPATGTRPTVGLIGTGSFARMVLLPAIRVAGVPVHSVSSARGVSGVHAARRFDVAEVTTDYRELLASEAVNTVFIATRHDTHARLAAEALRAGKHVFVEKPLAIDEEGLELVRAALAEHPHLQLMVGFNRRFAPHARKVRELLGRRAQPLAASILVNAGDIPAEHWIQDPAVGGGRIVGEACHFLDLLRFLVGCPIDTVQAAMFGPQAGGVRDDKMSVTLTFEDGSIGSVHYWANGPKSFPKERVEVFCAGRVLVIENWRRLAAYDWPGAPRMRSRLDKGHNAEVASFLRAVAEGGPSPIPFTEIDEVTRASFAAVRAAREARVVHLDPPR